MKIISKNCMKKQGESKKKRNMAMVGANAYLEAKPKISIDAIPFKKIKIL